MCSITWSRWCESGKPAVWSPLSASERGLGGEVCGCRAATQASPPIPLSEAAKAERGELIRASHFGDGPSFGPSPVPGTGAFGIGGRSGSLGAAGAGRASGSVARGISRSGAVFTGVPGS